MKVVVFIISIITIQGCIYEAGNRRSDLNISLPLSINAFYVESYLRNECMNLPYNTPLNSELINYPQDFVPLTDSTNKLKYVIELRVGVDSLGNNGWGLILSSVYSFENNIWISNRKNLLDNDLQKFYKFFRDSVMVKTVDLYRDKISDSVLFIDENIQIKIKPF